MKVNVVNVRGVSAIVTYRDKDGVLQAAIVDSDDLDSHRAGQEANITQKAMKQSTPYGIDWSLVFPDGIVIPSKDIQEVMYSQGIYTLEELIENTNKFIQAINGLARWSAAKLIRKVKEVLGGTE